MDRGLGRNLYVLMAIILLSGLSPSVLGQRGPPGPIVEIFDSKGDFVVSSELKVGESYKITRVISTVENQTMTYILLIQNEDGFTEHLEWKTFRFSKKIYIVMDLPWKPERTGEYTVFLFVWSSLDNPKPLEPRVQTMVKVQSQFS